MEITRQSPKEISKEAWLGREIEEGGGGSEGKSIPCKQRRPLVEEPSKKKHSLITPGARRNDVGHLFHCKKKFLGLISKKKGGIYLKRGEKLRPFAADRGPRKAPRDWGWLPHPLEKIWRGPAEGKKITRRRYLQRIYGEGGICKSAHRVRKASLASGGEIRTVIVGLPISQKKGSSQSEKRN